MRIRLSREVHDDVTLLKGDCRIVAAGVIEPLLEVFRLRGSRPEAMMLNSYVFIVALLSVWAAIDGSSNLLGMVLRVFRGSIYPDLATIAVSVRAVQASPVALVAPFPAQRFAGRNGSLNLLVGVPWTASHPCTEYLAHC